MHLHVVWTSPLLPGLTFLTRPIRSHSQPRLCSVKSVGATSLIFPKTKTTDRESCSPGILLVVSKSSPTCRSLWVGPPVPSPMLYYRTTSPRGDVVLLAWVLPVTSSALPLLHLVYPGCLQLRLRAPSVWPVGCRLCQTFSPLRLVH